MRQIAIISGKGGTGKTSTAAALASIMPSKVIADCDVDAADMHLLLSPRIERKESFAGGGKARIDRGECDGCGRCRELCRFGAISPDFSTDEFLCEGCGVCVWNCPKRAISIDEDKSGEWYVSETRCGPLVHARLGAGQENSGKLVALVRGQARRIAEKKGLEYVLIDGPPGTSCPVMASLTGVDAALIVTEPTLSGLHDLGRISDLLGRFKVPGFACINKCDLNPDQTDRIAGICERRGVRVLGRIPYDPAVIRAMIEGKTIVEYAGGGPVAAEIQSTWERIRAFFPAQGKVEGS